jgi:uncharacterized RDD family membrane protein YckC
MNLYKLKERGNYSMESPDSKVLFSRYFALLIDSFVIAFLVWLATRAFGTAQLTIDLKNGSAIPAALIDAGGTFYGATNLMGVSTNWVVKLPPLWSGLLVFCYFILQEAFFGATLGKALLGLRVIYHSANNTYTTLTIQAAIIRNLVRFVDALPSAYLVGWIVALISPRRQRLGDLAAHTLVVSRASVPYLTMPGKQVKQGFVLLAALLLLFTIVCQSFMYFGRPQLLIQNDITTDTLIMNKHIINYTLDGKTWGYNSQGQRTVTYTLSFVSVDLAGMPAKKLQSCQGSVTLVWHWSSLDWSEDNSGAICTDM